MKKKLHKGKFEYLRFDERRNDYYKHIKKISESNISVQDLLEHFPAYAGQMTLSRFIGLYELYKMTLGVSGHIAEVGVFKGASFFLFSKLVQIFEGESITQVHGFDWFQGTGKDEIKSFVKEGTYKESYQFVNSLIKSQKLENISFLHKMNVITGMEPFLKDNLHMQFKLIFLDAGMYNIVKTILPLLWDRLTSGGVLILDQYNHELSPGETLAVREILPNAKVRSIPNIWMPSGYIVKE